jgi:hypothetical protein
MTQDERNTVVERAYREYWDAKEALAALEASCSEIATTSSITTEEGYLMFSPSGLRLLGTDYVKELVAQYHAAKEHKEALRKGLIELGEPDPDPE